MIRQSHNCKKWTLWSNCGIDLLIVIVELANLWGNFSNLPSFKVVFRVKNCSEMKHNTHNVNAIEGKQNLVLLMSLPVLLLELPELKSTSHRQWNQRPMLPNCNPTQPLTRKTHPCVNVKCFAKVCLPVLVSKLGQVSAKSSAVKYYTSISTDSDCCAFSPKMFGALSQEFPATI